MNCKLKKIIMKTICTFLFALVVINTASAQGNFNVGTSVLGAGIGFGSSFGGGYGSQTPALSALYEHGVWDVGGPGVISLGGYIAHKSFSSDYLIYSSSWNYTIIGIRSAYHFNMINTSEWDLYGGAMISYRAVSFSDNGPGNNYGAVSSDIYFTLYAGGRYYFSENWAAYGELGSGIASLTLGVCYKF